MESYILKIYRSENGDENQMVGLLEGVVSGTLVNFKTFEELRDLLREAYQGKSKRKRRKKVLPME